MFVKEEVGGIKEKMRSSLLISFESLPPFSLIQVAFHSFSQLNVQPREVVHIGKFFIFWNTIVAKYPTFIQGTAALEVGRGKVEGRVWGFISIFNFFFLIFSFSFYKPCVFFIPYYVFK